MVESIMDPQPKITADSGPMQHEPTGKELETEVRRLLRGANLDLVTAKVVRKSLEEHFKLDLTNRKKEIAEIIDKIINPGSSSEEEMQDVVKPDPPKKSSSNKSSANNKSPEKKRHDSSSSSDNMDDEELARRLQAEEEAQGKRATRSGRSSSSRGSRTKNERKKEKKTSKKTKDGSSNNGYTKSLVLSPALADFTGETELPRHVVVKRVWDYVKEKNLHDPRNKQFALCDENLSKLFSRKRIRLFGMMKDLAKHFGEP